MPDVFMSYARPDRDTATKIYNELVNHDLEVMRDDELDFKNEQWEHAVHAAMLQSDSGLLLVSHASLNSTHVAREYQYFLQHNKRLYLALIESITIDQLPYTLRSLNYVDLARDFVTGINRLIDAIQNATDIHSTNAFSVLELEQARTVEIEAEVTEASAQSIAQTVQDLFQTGARKVRLISRKPNDEG